jgi:hypothetical protein
MISPIWNGTVIIPLGYGGFAMIYTQILDAFLKNKMVAYEWID